MRSRQVKILPLDQLRGLPNVPPVEYWFDDLPGIYFLWQQSRLVYIGMSKDVPRRIYHHRKAQKPFTHATWLRLPELSLRRFEQNYVLHYSPILNLTRLG